MAASKSCGDSHFAITCHPIQSQTLLELLTGPYAAFIASFLPVLEVTLVGVYGIYISQLIGIGASPTLPPPPPPPYALATRVPMMFIPNQGIVSIFLSTASRANCEILIVEPYSLFPLYGSMRGCCSHL
jgi:hypothetical protein